MNNKKLALAVMAVLLVAGLIGTGIMAWFTSQKSIENNLFQAGTLVIELAGDTPAEALMEFENMQPGDVEEATAVIKNAGSLPFKFYAIISEDDSVLGNGGAESEGGYLPDALDVTVTMGGGQVYKGTLTQLLDQVLVFADEYDIPVTIAAGATANIGIKVEFNTAAGNEYQGASFTGTITFIATQVNNPAEWQSFAFEKDKETEVSFPTQGVEMKVKAGEDSNTVISVERFDSAPVDPPAGMDPAGTYLNIKTTTPLPAGSEIVLEVSYLPLPPGVNEADLKLYRYNESTGQWVDLGAEVDTVKKVLRVTLSGFSTFGVFYDTEAEPLPVYNRAKGLSYDTIQAAVVDADAGDTIEIAAGTYQENVSIGENLAGLKLVGVVDDEGKPASKIIPASAGPGIKVDKASDVVIKNFEITGAYTSGSLRGYAVDANKAENIVIDNIYAHDNGDDAIKVSGTKYAVVKNSVSENNSGDGITFYSFGKILNNVVAGNAERGIYVSGESASGTGSVNIKGNRVYGNQNGGAIDPKDGKVGGIVVYSAGSSPAVHYAIIEGNVAYENVGPGIVLYKVNNTTGYGVPVSEDNKSLVKGNTVYANKDRANMGPGDGILIYMSHYVTIEDNEIYDNVGAGIRITNNYQYDSFGPTINNTVEGNTVYNNKYGILIEGGKNHKVENTVVKNNAIYGNVYGLANLNNFEEVVDATLNWWGHASGPSHADNPGGSGNPVSDNVLFDPWWANAAMTKEGSNTVVTVVRPNNATNATGSPDESYMGSGSWKNRGPSYKTTYNIYPTNAFGHSIKLNDIASLSYVTKKNAPQGAPDFYVNIYCTPITYRLSGEPLYSRGLNAPANQWNTWSTEAGTNQLTFYDSNRQGVPPGFYYGPTLAQLQAGPINWKDYYAGASSTNIDYGNMTINRFAFETSAGWSNFNGYIDAIVIKLKNGKTYIFDLEP
jgi:predicted ribosomally synthesized peptide with SipW-like signal peptide